MAAHTTEINLIDVYISAYGAPETHQPETGEWSGRVVCAEDGAIWPCRLRQALDAAGYSPGVGQ